MIPSQRIPLYIRACFLFIGIYLFIYTLIIGREILIPIAYAFIVSIVLSPFVSFLVRKKVNRIAAISIAVLISFFLTLGLIYFIASQLSMFNNALPVMKDKVHILQEQATQWIATHFYFSIEKIDAWFGNAKSGLYSSQDGMIGKTLGTISGILILVFLIPVYVFMILYYEPLLLVFSKKLFDKSNHQKLEEVLIQTKAIIQNYLIGLLIEAIIVGTLNSIALLVIGIEYAILIGIIGALFNMIPLVGGIFAGIIALVITVLTKGSSYYVLLVLLSYACIQFFDTHYITPRIVASKVKINALIAVIVVLIGNAIWGIPGMFLALPVTGILKVIFEHIETLKPWAFLLGDEMPASGILIFRFSKKKSK